MIINKNIIFVYNAKGGKWNYILDTVHKYASPSTYDCNLCKITHDLKMRESWKKFIESSPHNFKFLHSEELEEFKKLYPDGLPTNKNRYGTLEASADTYTLPNLLQMIEDARDAGNEDELELLTNDLELLYPGATMTI